VLFWEREGAREAMGNGGLMQASDR
jgi:hypothetical protein